MINLTSWGFTNRWTATTVLDRMNLYKTQTLTMWRRLLMKTLGSSRDPWMRPYWAPTRYTDHRPKNSDAALGQILDINFLGWFPSTLNVFRPDTRSIGSVLELSFQPYKVRPNPSPYATVASVLVRAVPGVRNGFEVDVVWASNWLGRPLLAS